MKTSIYFHLEETYNIKRWEIPLRINNFSNAVERIGARHTFGIFEDSFSALLTLIPDPAVVMDRKGTILASSQGPKEVTVVSAQKLVRENFLEVAFINKACRFEQRMPKRRCNGLTAGHTRSKLLPETVDG